MEWETRFELIKRARVLKALAHPSRLHFVTQLAEQEYCVQDLAAMVDCDVSTASKHLTVLRQAGILQDEKRGNKVWFSLRKPAAAGLIGYLAEVVEQGA